MKRNTYSHSEDTLVKLNLGPVSDSRHHHEPQLHLLVTLLISEKQPIL